MKLALLLVSLAMVCTLGSCFIDRRGQMGGGRGFPYPGTPPFNPGNRGLPDSYRNMRFRREINAEGHPMHLRNFEEATLDWNKIMRLRRDIPETHEWIQEPQYYV
ncbi:hypothetical protein O3M35_010577 [Rhynocoris fuscipes]|uniref:Uncharacterized protein n=1 Tax=Rhynocoris fuscipes TaxID=488301 RepID=A0AAW1D0E8_9HEMI